MITRLQWRDRTVWLKRYDEPQRRWRLGALDWITRSLGLTPLRPPPRRRLSAARQTEQRRLQELHALGIRVPEVIAAGDDSLLLSDLGPTLASRLRAADPGLAQSLTGSAIDAVASVHERGAYLGQPLARNLTVDGLGRVGFLDFEEDPGEVMSLADAQARDWLLFAAGISRYTPGDEGELGVLLRPAIKAGVDGVCDRVGNAVQRLGFIERCTRHLGRRAQGLGKALRALRVGALLWLLLITGAILGIDLAGDGDLDLILTISHLLF